MLILDKIPQEIIKDLRSRGHTDEDISEMVPKYAFAEILNWQCVIGGHLIWDAAIKLQNASPDSPSQKLLLAEKLLRDIADDLNDDQKHLLDAINDYFSPERPA